MRPSPMSGRVPARRARFAQTPLCYKPEWRARSRFPETGCLHDDAMGWLRDGGRNTADAARVQESRLAICETSRVVCPANPCHQKRHRSGPSPFAASYRRMPVPNGALPIAFFAPSSHMCTRRRHAHQPLPRRDRPYL